MSLDKYTIDQAKEFANNQAEIENFAIGSPRWKDAFKEYCDFAVGTMSIGRNPRSKRNPTRAFEALYPDIFQNIAVRWAKNYQGQDGKGIPPEAVRNRIMSSVSNLVKLFENAELGTKTTTFGNAQGKINNENMSDLQLPAKLPNQSAEEYLALSKAVVRNQMIRDLLTNIVLESLKPFMEMTGRDVNDIMGTVNWDVKSAQEFLKSGLRKSWITALRGVIGEKFRAINIRKLIFGS